ncbi:DsbA family protein [Chloroflexota bacterium]
MAERASLGRLVEELNIEVDWRGFELHPETPKGGMELDRLHPDNTKQGMKEYIEQFAARFGVQDMKPIKRMPNSRRALAVAEFARDQGKLYEYHWQVLDAYWKEGKDIEDSTVLSTLAVASGLDSDEAILAADNPDYLNRVDAMRVEYQNVGVGGIPVFVFGSEQAIEGFRPYPILAATAVRAGAKPKDES